MHLFEAGFRHGLISEATVDSQKYAKQFFLCPMLATVPEDGVLTYATVENAGDYVRADDQSVIMFREDQIDDLQLVVAGQDFFNTGLQVLYGVAGATYADWFDAATQGLPRVAYQGFLSEYHMKVTADRVDAARNETRHDSERRHLNDEGVAARYGDFSVGADDDNLDD